MGHGCYTQWDMIGIHNVLWCTCVGIHDGLWYYNGPWLVYTMGYGVLGMVYTMGYGIHNGPWLLYTMGYGRYTQCVMVYLRWYTRWAIACCLLHRHTILGLARTVYIPQLTVYSVISQRWSTEQKS